MGKRRKLPPLTAEDFKRALRRAGYERVDGTKHLAYEHPNRPGKVNIDEKWTGVKVGSWTFRSVVHEQMGMTTDDFIALLYEKKKPS